jgi:hypothetical protein
MKRKASGYIARILSGILFFFCSCTPESCIDDTEAFLGATFSSPALNQQAPDSLTVYGYGRDTAKIYSASRLINIASLPLNPSAQSTVFALNINGITDTISFYHYSYPHLISRECGYTYNHTLDSLTHTSNIIDSVWIRNNLITTTNEDNIRIFY